MHLNPFINSLYAAKNRGVDERMNMYSYPDVNLYTCIENCEERIHQCCMSIIVN
ncbi:MAG: hypothetical protein KTV77_04395 [Wolbachia endosymbiont of Fragariocoptes setiger]|nr:hypothetical protein [Wolbachia endosymbiont of Fragariocoptes setiger]